MQAGKPLDDPLRSYAPGGVCSFDGCTKPHVTRGLCSGHYQQFWLGKPLTPLRVHNRVAKRGEGHLTQHGYRVVYVDGKLVMEHRYIMEQALGRKLREFENVHHKNGRRADNRLENLELWVKSQPSGQRIEDLVRFIVTNYPEEVRAALG
jgi:hypothetical protein